ncbi:MAG TPA: bifunctional phosphoribosylaminoimidazolecarboxamide formyltransferase/IMP cyclohydrolase [Pyrinomonadaceae bacterium]|nr:bifunctional phosphoribosylaminoimidazolecarboxamide formyltransferase/IMP cyclohydrolase [Pyrinomonadaceae bacterium]
MENLRKIKRALISVSDKSGIVEFAQELAKFEVEIISTGGTARTLREQGIQVTEVSEITEFPEMMDGRVKTLHPKIHGAFLALRDNPEHQTAMRQHGIEPIDLVVVNLYPFEQTIEKEDVSIEEAVEQIDIGGPAMIRSAAKNWRDVAVVTDSRLYEDVLEEIKKNGGALSLETRRSLAALAFTTTSHYDLIISNFLTEELSEEEFDKIEHLHPAANSPLFQMFRETIEQLAGDFDDEFDDDFEDEDDFDDFDEEIEKLSDNNGNAIFSFEEDEETQAMPEYLYPEFEKMEDLRYGENPHQKAALYASNLETGGVAFAEQLHGKEMSYNNYLDADAAWRLAQDFEKTACAIIKHTNPSGVGVGENNLEAYRRALATDPVSAFGGIVAFNRMVDATTAEAVNEIFTEVVIAPDFADDALEIFKKKKNLRVLLAEEGESAFEYRKISGGMLIQTPDVFDLTEDDLRVVSERQPFEAEIRAMLFAWKVCKHVKSNAIVFANEFQTVGVGAGQMNRIDSVRIAAMRAERTKLALKGTVLASDAFFPFRDGVDEAAKFGISAIIQPGGSVRDEEVIQAANENGLAMVFTGVRHFKH